jgi:hypothetical protein
MDPAFAIESSYFGAVISTSFAMKLKAARASGVIETRTLKTGRTNRSADESQCGRGES